MITSPLALISILAGIVATVTALAMILLALWQAPSNSNNRLLAAYMATVALWGINIVMYRLSNGDPSFYEVAIFSFASNGFLLFAFVTHYLDMWKSRRLRWLLAVGCILYFVVAPIIIVTARIDTRLIFTDTGRIFQLAPSGKIGYLLTLGLLIAVTWLVWRHRASGGRIFLNGSIIALVGAVLLVVPVVNQFHIALIAVSISCVLFTRAILRDNLFNPLVELNKVLTTSEKHYRELAQELSHKENLYRTLAGNLPNTTVLLFDRTLRCLVREGQLPGLQSGSQLIEGKLLVDVLPQEMGQPFIANYQAAFLGNEASFQWALNNRDYQIHVLPVKDEQGKPFAGMVMIQDITAAKRAEREALELSLEKERVHILRKFISDASHDLLTPLTNVKLAVYLLEKSLTAQPDIAKILNMERQTTHLINMVTDMLEITRLDDQQDVDFESRNINEIIGLIVEAQHDAADKREQKVHFQPEGSPVIDIDVEKFDRAVTNIIANAITYTPQGGTINISTQQCETEFVIEVQDTGIGIAKEDLPRIFERFYRVDQARNADSGGTGLGLAITKRIIELHGGEIDVQSALGEGSCFRIHFPIKQLVIEA